MQFCGQLGIVHAAHAGTEMRWLVNAAAVAPLAGMPQPPLLPERRALLEGPSLGDPPPSAPAAPSLVPVVAGAPLEASLSDVSPLAAPLVVPPLEAPALLPLPDVARPEPGGDEPVPATVPEPAAPLPVPTVEPEPDPVDAPPPLLAPVLAPLGSFWGPGPVWLELQAAATKAAHITPWQRDARLTPASVEARAPFDQPSDA
jgi:hypothetical protein